MEARSSTGHELRLQVPATLDAIQEHCESFRKWAAELALPQVFAAELLLREALNNAVLHGCRCNPSKSVSCVLRFRRGRLTIAVRDDGFGFDWQTAMEQGPDLDACSGRGMLIYEHYADRIRFGRQGNSVVMVKQLNEDCIR